MMKRKVYLEHVGPIVFITMDASPRVNTIDPSFCAQMLAALDEAAHMPQARVIVLQAKGRVFSAGGDIRYLWQTLQDQSCLLSSLIDIFHEVILAIRRIPVPVIASVHGSAAAAGFSLAMACDLIVAARSARFVVGYPKLGVSSDGGLTFKLAKRIGVQKATELFFIDDSIESEYAKKIGLVNFFVGDDSLRRETFLLAERLASKGDEVFRAVKGLVNSAVDFGFEEHLRREKIEFLSCALTPDFRKRVQDFLES
ncbi:enoyl-CoA hydratase/isomerase family protein [Burkholderia stagnalis]